MLFEGDQLADHFKYDFDGELDYTELAHRVCGETDNKQRRYGYWETEERITPLGNAA